MGGQWLQAKYTGSELMLKNIEALAEEENIGGECNWIVIEYSPDHKECPSRTGAMCCTF